MANRIRRNPLVWEGGYWNSTPVWPREPNTKIIKQIAMDHLKPELPNSEKTLLEPTFFAGGAFNKLYLISYPGQEKSYLFRVILPACPFFKTESEAATLSYLQFETSIPVPGVIAWDSNPDNRLGFEWIIMEKVSGVPLRDVWRNISWPEKLVLTERLAELVHELGTHKFDRIGGLYFTWALENHKVDHNKEKALPASSDSSDQDNGKLGINGKMSGAFSSQTFTVGPLFSPMFYLGSRLYLPGNRGPYRRASEWLESGINMQLQWVKAGRVEGDSFYAKDFEKEVPEIESECHRYLETLPKIISNEQGPCYELHHGDLNSANILVDPETFSITAIVDWEMINIVPAWKASDYPVLLQDIEPEDDEEPPIPSYEEEHDLAVYTRDQWDYKILRQHYDATMKRLTGGSDATDKFSITKNMRDFESQIQNLSDNIGWAQQWLEGYLASIEESHQTQAASVTALGECGTQNASEKGDCQI